MKRPDVEAVKRAAHTLYDGHWDSQLRIFIDKDPKMLRHEDKIMGCSGTWVDCSVFVPDEDLE